MYFSNSIAAVPIQPWRYSNNLTSGEPPLPYPGGTIGVINLANSNYKADDFIHMAIEYINISGIDFPINFQWSTLTINDRNISPDENTGYDGNVAYISASFTGTWDAVSLPYNEYGTACVNIVDLNAGLITDSGKCTGVRNAALGTSPNVRYAVIYLNTNGTSTMTPLQDKRRQLLVHEMGHVLGLDHATSGHCFTTAPSTSVMVKDNDPSICAGVPITLQPVDNAALAIIY